MMNLKNAQFVRVANAETEVIPATENTKGAIIYLITISARSNNNNFVRMGADKYLYYGNPAESPDSLTITGLEIPAGQALTVNAGGGNSFICVVFEVLT